VLPPIVTEDGIPEDFTSAMNDDLGVPAALAVIHASIRRGNVALQAGDLRALRQRLRETVAMTQILGIAPHQWPGAQEAQRRVVEVLTNFAITTRAAARARGDYAAADSIRRQLADVGITVHDTEGETQWKLSPTTHV
jgi:cysteinyl-tRNA synthetase